MFVFETRFCKKEFYLKELNLSEKKFLTDFQIKQIVAIIFKQN